MQLFVTSADYNQFENMLFEVQDRARMRIYAYFSISAILLIIGIVGSLFIFPKVVYSQSGAFKDCVIKYCGGGGCYATSDGRPANIKQCQDMVSSYGNTAKAMCKRLGGSDADCNRCSGTLACQGVDFSTSNPLGSVDVPGLVGNFLRAFFALIGVIALVIFIYGGLLWMTSIGEEDRVKRGRETMIWAGLGLIAIFGSYVAVQFILNAVLSPPRPATGAPATTSIATRTSGTATASGGTSSSSGGVSSGSTPPGETPSSTTPSSATPETIPPPAMSPPAPLPEETAGGISEGTIDSEDEGGGTPRIRFNDSFLGDSVEVTLSASIGSYENLAEKHGIQFGTTGYTVGGRSFTIEDLTSTNDAHVETMDIYERQDGSVLIFTYNSDATGTKTIIKDGRVIEVESTSIVPGQSEHLIRWNYDHDVIDAFQEQGWSATPESFVALGRITTQEFSLVIQEYEGLYTSIVSMEADKDSGELYIEIERSDGSQVIYTMKDGVVFRVVKWCKESPESTERVLC